MSALCAPAATAKIYNLLSVCHLSPSLSYIFPGRQPNLPLSLPPSLPHGLCVHRGLPPPFCDAVFFLFVAFRFMTELRAQDGQRWKFKTFKLFTHRKKQNRKAVHFNQLSVSSEVQMELQYYQLFQRASVRCCQLKAPEPSGQNDARFVFSLQSSVLQGITTQLATSINRNACFRMHTRKGFIGL